MSLESPEDITKLEFLRSFPISAVRSVVSWWRYWTICSLLRRCSSGSCSGRAGRACAWRQLYKIRSSRKIDSQIHCVPDIWSSDIWSFRLYGQFLAVPKQNPLSYNNIFWIYGLNFRKMVNLWAPSTSRTGSAWSGSGWSQGGSSRKLFTSRNNSISTI